MVVKYSKKKKKLPNNKLRIPGLVVDVIFVPTRKLLLASIINIVNFLHPNVVMGHVVRNVPTVQVPIQSAIQIIQIVV